MFGKRAMNFACADGVAGMKESCCSNFRLMNLISRVSIESLAVHAAIGRRVIPSSRGIVEPAQSMQRPSIPGTGAVFPLRRPAANYLSGVLLSLALLSCAPADSPHEQKGGAGLVNQQQSDGQAPTPVPDFASVAGKWDVVSFEGYEPRRLSGTLRAAYADFGEDGVSLRIECNYSGRPGKVSNGRFVAPDKREGGQTVMSCGPERNGRESRYFSFFEKNPTIERTGSDRLRLRADGTELILARPAAHRLRFVPTTAELQGKWRMTELTHYLSEGGYTGGGMTEVPGRIVFSGDRLFYNRCPQYGATVRLDDTGRLKKTGGAAPPPAGADCRELSGPATAPRQPKPSDVLSLLHSEPAVEWVDKDTLLLSTQRLGLLVTKAACERLEQSNDHRRSWMSNCASPE
jgi:heat shock protein HslJ